MPDVLNAAVACGLPGESHYVITNEIIRGIGSGIVLGFALGGIALVGVKGLNLILCRVFKFSDKKAKWIVGALSWVLTGVCCWYWFHSRAQRS